MNWDTFYKQFQAKQPQITWDEYYKTLPIKAPVYTTEMLYNTQAKPKTKFTETDFQPLNIEWKFDWSQYGSYDETDPTEQLRKIRNVPPYSIVSTYDFSDSEDKKRFEEGLPSKALESRILSTQARKEARAYLQERQRLFEDLLKQKQSEKILGIFPKKVQKIEPKDYTPAEIPPTVAAWLGYQEALKTYQQEIEDLKKYEPKTYAYKELIGTLPKPPEPPMFEPPEEFQYLEKDLWEEYIKKQEEERRRQEEEKRKARQTTAIPATRTTEPPSTTPQPIQPSGIETLKRIAERYPVTLSGPVYRAQQEVTQPQESKEQSPGKKILEDFFKLDKKTVDKFAQNVRKVHISDKVTWGDVFKNAVKAGMIKMGSSWAKTGKTLLGWLPDNIENALIYGGVPYEKMQEDYDRMLAEIETEMKESAPVQKFIYTGASASIPLLTNYLLASFMSAPVAAKPATVAGKIGKAAIQTASKLPYTAYFYGSYAREAEREGATPEQQLLYGIVGATIETVTEAPIVERMLGKGISTTLMNKMMKTGGKTLINRLGRIGVETLFNIGMETGQEIIAGIGSTFAKQMIYEPDTKLSWQQVGEDAYGGLAMATVLSALGLPVRYNAHKMAETLIDNASKGEKVTTDQIIQLAEQTQQDLNDMTAKDKAELTKTVNEEAKTVDEVLRLPMPSPENVARMQFDTAINNIREQLIAYTTKTDLDVTTRQNIRNTVINNINLATELNKQYGFELPNYIRNAAQILEQQPSVETIEVPASEQTVTQQPAPSRYTQYIGQQVTLKPPYGNVTVKGETDTHVIVDKQGEEKRILKNAFSRLIEQEPAPLPEQVQDEIPADSVRVLPVNAINVDPARFQFKADVESKTGASRTLDIKKWDPYLAGVVLVWQDNNGRYWVVNGHHRLQKAKELGVDTINVHVIREADGYSDKDARELGAKINIAEGHGTLTDAAKLFRDGGYTLEQIQEEGLPLRSGNALKGLHLAQLNDNLFDKVITKQLTEEKGAIIGEILPTDKGGINDAKQNYIWDKIKDARVSADEVREMAEMLKDADAKPRTEQTLLGEWLVWDIADFDIKPKLIADTKSVLISNKNAFNKVLKNSKALQEAGNVLVEGENIRRRDLLSQAVAIVDRGKNLKGHPINDILNIYTEQIKAGMSKSTAAEKAANEIVELIASGKYFEQMKKELQAAKVKTGEQIDMLGGFKSEVEERDSQQGERVSQDTGEIQAADTEAAATAEARTTSPKEPWQMTKDEFIQNVLDKKYDFPRLGTKGEMMSKYVDAYKNTLKRDPETAEIALSRIKEAATNEHKANILEAIVEGKPVPEKILKDYPDIQQGAQVSGDETKILTPEQLIELNQQMIEKGQPITRDSVGYNKLDFYFAYSLSKETQLSNKQLASLANTLAKYGKTQLNIDPQILKNTAEHYRKLSEAGTIPISIQHQPSGGNEWIAEIAGRDEKYKYKRKFLKPAKREWSSTGKTGITIFRLEEGKIYEINEPYKGRRFVKVENGEIKPIEQGEVAQSSVTVSREQSTEQTVSPQYQGRPDLSNVVGIVPPGMQIKRIDPSQGYQFDNLDLEAQYQADYGLPKETFVQKVKDNITELWHMTTRTYKEIPENNPYYAEAVNIITQMNDIADISKDEAVRTLDYITDGLNRKEFDVFSKYLYLKDMEESIARGEAIRKGWNQETVQNELKRIEPYLNQNVRQALDRRRERLQSVTQDLINAMAQLGIDLSDTFNRQDYFRHQVLEYAHAKNFANYSSGAKAPRKRGFMYERTGEYTGAYNTNYLEAEYEVLAQMMRDTKMANLLKRFMDNYDISAQVRQTASEQGLENWKDAIPEGYTTYQLRDGNVFYTTTSIADQVVVEILSNLKDGAVVKAEDLKTVLAVGGKFKEYVIKEELANKLENLFDKQPSNVVASASRAIQNSFKRWVTGLNLFYFVKFNLRNLSGDWARALSANYRIVKPEYLKRALSEVKQAMVNGSFTPEMLQWTQRGGFEGLLVPQETQDVGQFFPEYEREKAKQVFNMLYKAVPKTVKGWINFTEKTSIYREAILKYAAFLHYLDAQKAGKPDYGAAPPAMIRGLKDPVDRAFVLSEYAIGAYSRTSELGRLISRHLIPFWRFSESNFKAHYQLLKNAVDSSIIAEQLEYKGKPVTPINKLLQASLNLSTKIALIAGLGLITYVFNALVFPEEEELLPDHVKDEPHIILGTDSNGRIIYFTRVGALHDVLEWAIDTGDIVRLITGETTVSEVAKKMPKKTLQKVVDSLSPFYKLPFELVSGRRLYPDALRPSNIRDRALYVWQSLGLEWLGREVLGLPNRDIQVMLQNIIAYQTEPDAAAYQTILDRKREFEQKQGKYPTQVYNESPKSYALYNYKLALKYKDYGTAKKFLDLYYKLGGTRKGLKQSMNTLSPIYGLSGKELREFEKWLSESDRKKLKRAMRYYKELKDLGQSLK